MKMNDLRLMQYILGEIEKAKLTNRCFTYVTNEHSPLYISLNSDVCNHNWVSSYLDPYLKRLDEIKNERLRQVYFTISTEEIWSIFLQYIDTHNSKLKPFYTPKNNIQIFLFSFNSINVFFQLVENKPYQIVAFLENEIFVFAPNIYSKELHFFPMRAIRNLVVVENLNRGKIIFHASGVVSNNKAYIFIGDKLAGKTTSMISFLKYGGYNLLTNDRILISPNELNEFTAIGLPIAVGIRPKTFKFFPQLIEYVKENQLCYYSQPFQTQENFLSLLESISNSENLNKPKITFTPKELAEALNVSISTLGKLAYIFILDLDLSCQKLEIHPLSNEQAISILLKNKIDNISEHQPFWNSLLEKNYEGISMIKSIVNHCNIIKIRYNHNVIHQLFDYLDKNT